MQKSANQWSCRARLGWKEFEALRNLRIRATVIFAVPIPASPGTCHEAYLIPWV
jgi:hypothetical protein